MARKTEVLAADFETTTVDINDFDNVEEYQKAVREFEPEVYSWAIAKRNNYNDFDIKDGIDIYSFIEEIMEIDYDAVMYFHNGAKFDLQFLLPALTELGYKQLLVEPDKLLDSNDFDFEAEYPNITIESKNRYLQAFEFSCVVDGNHKIMELKIALPCMKGKRNRVLIIRDSNLMFASRLADYGKALNKKYNTDIWNKLEIDGGYTRSKMYETYEEFIQDGNEQEYLHMDVKILSEFLHMMIEVLPFNKWKMTAAGTAYSIWKNDFFGQKLLAKAVKEKKVIEIKLGDVNNPMTKYRWKNSNKIVNSTIVINKLVEEVFPTKWLDESDLYFTMSNYELIQSAYQGGLTMANPDTAGIKQENLAYIDINSSYPTQMMQNIFPYGGPLLNIPKDWYGKYIKLWTLKIKKVNNEKGIPFLHVYSESATGKHYQKEIEYREYILTDTEKEQFEKYYTGDYEFELLCGFKKMLGYDIFGEYINFFYQMKSNAGKDQAKKLYAKLMLNSLYGKYGQDVSREQKVFLGPGNWSTIATTSDAKFYLPLAVFITAEARMYMVNAVGKRFEYVNYMDTDSLSIRCPDVDLHNEEELIKHLEKNYEVEIDSNVLGGWDIEHKLEWQITRRAKQYLMKDIDGSVELKFAGLNMKEQDLENLSKKEFLFGKQNIKQLRPVRMPTGLVLEEYDKQILPIWEYNLNPSYWFQNEKQFKEKIKEDTYED